MIGKFVAIPFFAGATIFGFFCFDIFLWLRRNKRFNIDWSREKIEEFYLLRKWKKAGLVISILGMAICLVIAGFLSN